jgi:hypothetical protein
VAAASGIEAAAVSYAIGVQVYTEAQGMDSQRDKERLGGAERVDASPTRASS